MLKLLEKSAPESLIGFPATSRRVIVAKVCTDTSDYTISESGLQLASNNIGALQITGATDLMPDDGTQEAKTVRRARGCLGRAGHHYEPTERAGNVGFISGGHHPVLSTTGGYEADTVVGVERVILNAALVQEEVFASFLRRQLGLKNVSGLGALVAKAVLGLEHKVARFGRCAYSIMIRMELTRWRMCVAWQHCGDEFLIRLLRGDAIA